MELVTLEGLRGLRGYNISWDNIQQYYDSISVDQAPAIFQALTTGNFSGLVGMAKGLASKFCPGVVNNLSDDKILAIVTARASSFDYINGDLDTLWTNIVNDICNQPVSNPNGNGTGTGTQTGGNFFKDYWWVIAIGAGVILYVTMKD
jgi:hypothetical protein